MRDGLGIHCVRAARRARAAQHADPCTRAPASTSTPPDATATPCSSDWSRRRSTPDVMTKP